MSNLPAIARGTSLPGTASELHDYVLLSHEKVKAYKLVLKSASRQGAKELYEKTLTEAQIVGESALYAEARMGEMLEAVPKVGKRHSSTGGTMPSLPAGVDKKSSHYAQELARHPEAIKAVIAEAKKRGDIPTRREVLGVIRKGGHAVHYSSETPEHYTPKVILDAVIACLGEIDLDPCSNSGDPNVPARMYFTEQDDGLACRWHGRVFMNPPYGRDIGPWVLKLQSEHEQKRVSQAIALVPSRTDTEWFSVLRDYPVCFVRGRLTFVGNAAPAPFPSAVFYLGDDLAPFTSSFGNLGDIWARIK